MGSGLKRTPLYAAHVRLGGKMVPFAGFEMPVQYATGAQAEHRAARESCGLFDASHMGELDVRGPDALELLQKVTVNDVSALDEGQAQYTVMCREDGGMIDDLLVYRFEDHYMLVVNAANRDTDLAWILGEALEMEADVEDRSDEIALIALQGPWARVVLRRLTEEDIDEIPYYCFRRGRVADADAVISRTGYTGEDGFELYVDSDSAMGVWQALVESGRSAGLRPAGLGARDSLRLEMGYALYGNELDEEHTPLEAGLGWLTKIDKGDFLGRDALVKQKHEGLQERLVGLKVDEKGFPRAGYGVHLGEAQVGTVTSGTFSPSLEVGIALAYVPFGLSGAGTTMKIDVRGRLVPAKVVELPFYHQGSIRR